MPLPAGCAAAIPQYAAAAGYAALFLPEGLLRSAIRTAEAALEQGFFSGVDFIASVHAASAEEAVRRPQVKALQQQGMLRVLVLLQGCAEPGRVRQIDEL